MPKVVHELIAETAKDMAKALFEELCKDNHWYTSQVKSGLVTEASFVEFTYGQLIEQARTTLAGMLGGGFPEDLKAVIFDALVKDSELPRKRNFHEGKLGSKLVQ
jgi:hypothetical protein